MRQSLYAPNKLTIRQVTEMRRQFLAGTPRDTLAVWHDICKSTVWYHTSDLRRPKPKIVDRSKVLDMLIAGKSQSDIAREFNVSTSAITQIVKKMRGRA